MGIKAIDSVGPAGAKTAQPDLGLLSMPAGTDFREQPVNEVVPEGAGKNPTAPNSPSFNLREVNNPNFERVSFEPPGSPSSLNFRSVAEKGWSKLLDFKDPNYLESKQAFLKSPEGISFKLKSVVIDAYIKDNYPASPRSKATPSESTLRLKADGAKAFSSKLGPSSGFSESFSKKGMAPGPHGAGGRSYGDPGSTNVQVVASGKLLRNRFQPDPLDAPEGLDQLASVDTPESSNSHGAQESNLFYAEGRVPMIRANLRADSTVSTQELKTALAKSAIAPLVEPSKRDFFHEYSFDEVKARLPE